MGSHLRYVYRGRIGLSQEIEDILIADAALTIAFAILLSNNGFGASAVCTGVSGVVRLLCRNPLLYFLPISFVAVSLSFILHEYMHKIVAQRFGAIAAFKRSDLGILITLITSFAGFLMGLPGATMIYTNVFTKKEEGYTSLAGPLTNLGVFLVFYAILLMVPIQQSSYLAAAVTTTLFISIWLAFVNMLPVYPLDGSKVLRWNKMVYATVLILIIGLLSLIVPLGALLYSVVIVLILSLIMSVFFRGAIFRYQ